ncbi:DUF4349 domain-containing protein [Peribacillus deserti]|uniref:DUF4349 domain-containing protein n=1 Tax=Peribacillus deserti TaxID=673318 RepID=A0A2N5M4F2_9BACI|nr:DUF4349 domain-containing protein [Peribacillus deserti]PLT29237.1 DUF4349 domain-containing protein [Peribacillus deserti]
MKRVNHLLTWFAVFFLAFALAACSHSKEESNSGDSSMKSSKSDSAMDKSKENISTVEDGGKPAETQRKMIYQAQVDLEVKDFKDSQTLIEKEIQNVKGQMINQEVFNTEGNNQEGTFTLRVPQPSFQEFLRRLQSLKGVQVTSQNIQGNDVTEEYVDLSSRLKAKQAVEARLYAFMKEAKKTEELLQISRDLGTVQEEIENIKGRMQFLDKNSQMSTVTLHIREDKVIIPDIDSKELNTWERSKQSFVHTLQGLISVISGLLVFLIGGSPVLVPVVLIAAGVWYWYKKKRRNE